MEQDFAAQDAATAKKTDAKRTDQKHDAGQEQKQTTRRTIQTQVETLSVAISYVDGRARQGTRLIEVPASPLELGVPNDGKASREAGKTEGKTAQQVSGDTGRTSVEATPHRAIPESAIGRGRAGGRSQKGGHIEQGPNKREREMRSRIGMGVVAIRMAQQSASFESFSVEIT